MKINWLIKNWYIFFYNIDLLIKRSFHFFLFCFWITFFQLFIIKKFCFVYKISAFFSILWRNFFVWIKLKRNANIFFFKSFALYSLFNFNDFFWKEHDFLFIFQKKIRAEIEIKQLFFTNLKTFWIMINFRDESIVHFIQF